MKPSWKDGSIPVGDEQEAGTEPAAHSHEHRGTEHGHDEDETGHDNPHGHAPKPAAPTPGPWRLGKNGGVVADVPIIGGPDGSDDVAYYGGHLICESVTESNARLIAAAPDLLAACEAIHDAGIVPFAAEKAGTQRGRNNANYADELLRAAIAKARGGAR